MAENFAVFDEATANDLLATMAAIKDGGLLDPKQDETKRGLDGRKVENTPIPTIVYNTSGQVVPAYGLMQVIGNLDEDSRNYVTIKRPADSVPPGLLLINGPTEIAAVDGYGIAQSGPTYRLLHDGGTYAAGYTLGINIGAFTATAGHMFSVLGDDELTSGTDNVVRVMFADPTRLVLAYTVTGATGRSGTTLGKGTATMRYLAVSGTDRVLTETTDTAPITFYNLAATSVGTNKYLMLLRFGDILLANWEEC